MDKYFMWIHYERLHNHNKAKHNKTVYIFLGIYCIDLFSFTDDYPGHLLKALSLKKYFLRMVSLRQFVLNRIWIRVSCSPVFAKVASPWNNSEQNRYTHATQTWQSWIHGAPCVNSWGILYMGCPSDEVIRKANTTGSHEVQCHVTSSTLPCNSI